MDKAIIAVSKRCCPVCWELMDILRTEPKQFQVRGRHATLLPVELPSWLEKGHIDEMITRFKQIVRDELVDMLANVVYVRTPPRQSVADSTTGSHMDDDEGVPGADGFEDRNLREAFEDDQAPTPFIPADNSSSTSDL